MEASTPVRFNSVVDGAPQQRLLEPQHPGRGHADNSSIDSLSQRDRPGLLVTGPGARLV
jgi:hypothetical protein